MKDLTGVILTEDTDLDAIFDMVAEGKIEEIETETITVKSEVYNPETFNEEEFWAQFEDLPEEKAVVDYSKDANVIAEIAMLEVEIKELENKKIDWENRVYKASKKTIQTKFDIENEQGYKYSVNTINKRRKENRIKLFSYEIAKREEHINDLKKNGSYYKNNTYTRIAK
jgi:hypothetical protein